MRWWKTYRILSEMKERLRWSTEEIQRYQLWKLRDLIEYAYFHSPFYRRFYDERGIHPDHIRSSEDIKRLPILEKKDIQEMDPMEMVTLRDEDGSPQKIAWMDEVTGGSTGYPLKIRRTWRDLYYTKAKVIRAFGQTGFRFYHRQVILKSSAESLTGKHWFEYLGILRKYWLSVVDPPSENLQKLEKIRPQHVHAYPSGLAVIAELLLSQNRTFHIPIICTGAEVLERITREKITRAFQAEVFDLYASREVGNIAWECRAHRGLHINDDAIIVELLDENGMDAVEGQEGEVIVTYLDGRDFPFIRYRLGDRAIKMSGNCSCGVAFQRLELVTGRSDSRILLPSGEWISGLVFQELRTANWLSSFRIIQEDPHSIKLQIVLREKPGEDKLKDFVAKTKSLLRNQLEVNLEILPRIEPEESGKIRTVICRLPSRMDIANTASSGEKP